MPDCTGRKRIALVLCAGIVLLFHAACVAQTIQPIIVEYTVKADGKFEVTNGTLTPMAVVLEPKSFSIASNGRATYRPLDPGIHLDLSSMSFRLEPQQSYYIFYKASAETLPAWFTIYAVFSPIQKEQGVRLRVMLPHTVYLYQKRSVPKEAIHIEQAEFDPGRNLVICDVENTSASLIRAQEARAVGGKESSEADGFPLLPRSERHLEIPWNQTGPPSYLLLRFPHFDIKEPLKVKSQ
jgi:hypothetical protein